MLSHDIQSWLLLAICGVLLAYDNKKRPDMAYGLSLNTIVARLATASKSSLVIVVGEAIGQFKCIWLQNSSNGQLLDVQTFDSAQPGATGFTHSVVSTPRPILGLH